MLTSLRIRNFKQFEDVEIELGNPVVFIGPNNSGKTTALQALALWDLGVKRWLEKRAGKKAPEKRPGVTINRRDLVAAPVPAANLLWRDLHVRNVTREAGKQETGNVRMEVVVEGVDQGQAWQCGLEFDYANEESFYCRPLRLVEEDNPPRMPVPEQAGRVRLAFLPPMSGLSDREFAMQPGQISFLLGQGRTAEVLRNLCHQLHQGEPGKVWARLVEQIQSLFGVSLDAPVYIEDRSEITMTYQNRRKVKLDLSCAGRGLHQVLLLLAFLAVNPKAVLLLDEPDAHLEILRQRDIYNLLSNATRQQGGQIVVASHSEVILNEAADRDTVVAFLGQPHRMDRRGSQLRKSLNEIGWDQYSQALQKGWVLYLEGSTDLSILQSFARRLKHPVSPFLEDKPFVYYIGNQPQKARSHFEGLREARPDLVGYVLCDRLDQGLQPTPERGEKMWSRREIENYLCQPATLLACAEAIGKEAGPLFPAVKVMQECIEDLIAPRRLRDPADPWWSDEKASDDILDPIFSAFFERLGLQNQMRKSAYYTLAEKVPADLIADEVRDVLDAILAIAARARPAAEFD